MAVDTSRARKELARILDIDMILIAKPEKNLTGWRVCYEYLDLVKKFKVRVGIVEDKNGERALNIYFNNKRTKFERLFYFELSKKDIETLEIMLINFIRD